MTERKKFHFKITLPLVALFATILTTFVTLQNKVEANEKASQIADKNLEKIFEIHFKRIDEKIDLVLQILRKR